MLPGKTGACPASSLAQRWHTPCLAELLDSGSSQTSSSHLPNLPLTAHNGMAEWDSGFHSLMPCSTVVQTWAMPGVTSSSVDTGAHAKGIMPCWHRGQVANLWSPSSCAPTALPGPGHLQLMQASHLHPPPGPWAGRRATGTRTSSGSSPTVTSPTHKALGFFLPGANQEAGLRPHYRAGSPSLLGHTVGKVRGAQISLDQEIRAYMRGKGVKKQAQDTNRGISPHSDQHHHISRKLKHPERHAEVHRHLRKNIIY